MMPTIKLKIYRALSMQSTLKSREKESESRSTNTNMYERLLKIRSLTMSKMRDTQIWFGLRLWRFLVRRLNIGGFGLETAHTFCAHIHSLTPTVFKVQVTLSSCINICECESKTLMGL